MSNKARILAAIQARPGIGVAELADTLGMFQPNARRDALQLRDKGLVTAEEGGGGLQFLSGWRSLAGSNKCRGSLWATSATTRAAD